MEKIKTWRRFALALLALLCASVLIFALTEIAPADADAATPDLSENTATYRLDEETMDPWRYTAGTNWYWYSEGQQGSNTENGHLELKFTITGGGKFIFEWHSDRYGTDLANDYCCILTEATHTHTTDGGTVDKFATNEALTREESSTSGCKDTGKRYEREVKEGDVIDFKWTTARGTAKVYFMPPENTSDLKVTVAEDSQGGGHIDWSDADEKSGTGTDLQLAPQWGKSITLKAVPEDGYEFTGWTDETGAAVYNKAEYAITNTFGARDQHYYAHFLQKGTDRVTLSKKGELDQWSVSDLEDGEGGKRYTLIGENHEVGDEATLTYEFIIPEGGAYLDFGYFYSMAGRKTFQLYLLDSTTSSSGSSQSAFIPYNIPVGSEQTPLKYVQWISTPGAHRIWIRFTSNKIGGFDKDTDTLFIDNPCVHTSEDIKYSQVSFEIADSFQVQVNYDGLEAPEILTHDQSQATIPLGLTGVEFKAVQVQEKHTSTIDPDQQVAISFLGFTGNFTSADEDAAWTQTAKSFYFTFYDLEKVGVVGISERKTSSYTNYNLPKSQEETYDTPFIQADYKEDAPAFVVKAQTKTAPDQEQDIGTVENGQTIDFPFNRENTLLLYIKKFSQGDFNLADFTFTVDGVAQTEENLTDTGSKWYFAATVKAKATYELTYTRSDGQVIWSAVKLSFSALESVEGGLENILDTKDLTVKNEIQKSSAASETYDFAFDPVNSAPDHLAYGLRVKDTFKPNGFADTKTIASQLVFTLNNESIESGSLTFEFKIGGYFSEALLSRVTSGQLWFGTKRFTSNNARVYLDGTIDGATMLAQMQKDGNYAYSTQVVHAEGGWFRASIPIQKGQTIYVAFLASYDGTRPSDTVFDDSWIAVRDVNLVSGLQTITLDVSAEHVGSAKATVGEDVYETTTEGKQTFTVNAGSVINLEALLGSNEQFYGWSVNGRLASTEAKASILVEGESNIVAYMAPTGTYSARAEGVFYPTIKDAVEQAKVNDIVYVVKDGAEITESFTIKAGVTLLLPYNDEGGFYEAGTTENGADNHISWFHPQKKDTYRHLTVYVRQGAKITVQGTLQVGGIANYLVGQGYQGHTSGAYAELILDKGSSIEIADGGVMDVYGRVWGGNGHEGADMGTIDVALGGKLYEPFLILDFSGGSNTLSLFESGQTPFKRYAMVNIEVPFTVHYGAQLWGHASLYASSLSMHTSLDQPFVSYDMGEGRGGDGTGANTFVMLANGASVTVTYNGAKIAENAAANGTEGIGETTMKFEGGATFCDMRFSAMGFTVPTTGVYFSIPYNFQVEMNDFAVPQGDVHAQYETKTDFKVMPGASVKVGAGATLTLNANVYVYDGLVQTGMSGKSYPSAEQLKAVGYKTNGTLIVDGTLVLGTKTPVPKFEILGSGGGDEDLTPRPATFLGVVQTSGSTGKIVVPAGATVKGTIVDGANAAYDCNYAAYESSMRLYDKVHGCLTAIPAGDDNKTEKEMTFSATWTAQDNNSKWTLEGVSTTYESGNGQHAADAHKTPVTTNLPNAEGMIGSWKIDHTEHHASAETWQYRDTDGTASAGGHEELHRYCDELGCEEQETRYLLGTPENGEIGNFVYRGTAFLAEELVQLFKENYAGFNFQYLGFDGASKDVTVSASDVGTHIEVSADGYTVTVTLSEGAYFLQDGQLVDHFTFKWRISAFDLGEGSAANAVLEALSRVYNGTDTTIGVQSVTAHLREGSGTPLTAEDYTVSYEGDKINVTEAGVTVKINGQGNYTGTLELTYRITPKAIVLTLDKQTADYSGNKPSVDQSAYSVNGDAETLFKADIAKGLTVTVDFAESPEKWDAKLYDLTVTLGGTGKDNYSLTADGAGKFEIAKKDLSDGVIALSEESIVYDGNSHEPFAGFTLAGFAALAQGTDYTVTYEGDKINVTESVTVKVTGSGNFKGEATKTFKITARNIADGKEGAIVQTPDGGFVYKGEAWTPDIKITIAGVQGAIAKDICYTLGYENNEAAGTATVTVTGTHNFNGSFELNFTIARKTLTIKPEPKHSPKGQDPVALTATAEGLIEKDRAQFLEEIVKIYRLSVGVSKDSDEGTYDITVVILMKDWGSYSVVAGDGSKLYTVTPAVFANVKFPEANSSVYNGQVQKFEVVLGAPAEGTDGQFGDVTYTYTLLGAPAQEMKNAGTYLVKAHVTFTTTDQTQYETEIEGQFTINPKSINGAEVTLADGDRTFTTKQITPSVTKVEIDGLTLQANEYTVKYSSNINVGEATVTVTANEGNFTGDATATFTITARDLSHAKITVANGKLTYNGGEQQPEITVTLEINDETVTLSKDDFDVQYSNNTHVGKATVTIKGKTNYANSATNQEAFEIVKKEIEIKLSEQTFEYAGSVVPDLSDSAWTAAPGAVCEKDELNIVLSLTKTHAGKWDVGTYSEAIEGAWTNSDYQVNFVKGTLKITPKAITVTIGDHRSQYGDEYEDATFTVEPSALAEGDDKSVLGVTLTWEGASGDIRLTPGSYYISGQADPDCGNYTVTFTGSHGTSGTYTVDPREVTVKILPQEEIYDNKEFSVPQEQDSGWTVEAGSILDGEDLNVTLEKDPGTAVTKEGYTIRGRSANPYYHVTWQDGTFTVKPRPVVVLIRDQSAMYVYDHTYAFDEDLWTLLTDEGRLAENEEKDILGITLSVGELTNAGKYAISGAAGNENYTVTFRGSYEGDTEELVGKAGVYTVEKQDVSGAALFILLVGDGGTSDGMTVHAKFAGKPLALTSTVTVFEGQTPHSLASTLDRESVAEIGNFDVKVTVVDDNYSGEAVFLVIVTDEVGYTKNLKDTLARLAELAEGLDAEHLTTDDYGTLVEIYNALSALTDEERSVGAGELARYQAYVDAWEQLTDIDDVIKTAEEIANAPIKALFGAAATLTALAALAYIVKKGGRL